MRTQAIRFLLICLIIATMRHASGSAPRPNVLMFAVDDLCDWVGAMGSRQAITPHMDALAQQGTLFTNAHAPGVYCAPSRTAIFTGRFASTTGCYENEIYHYDHPGIRPLQMAFQDSGYATFGAGKLFHHREGYLDRRGWDAFYVRNATLRRKGWRIETWPMAPEERDVPFPVPFPSSAYNQGKTVNGGLFLEWAALPNDQEAHMADTRRANYACEILSRDTRQPFFLAVGLYTPHFPNYAPQKYFDLYDPETLEAPPYYANDTEDLPEAMRRRMDNRRKQHHDPLVAMGALHDAIHGYLASVSYADAMLGRVLTALRDGPHADNTLIVFWSDHGYHHGEKGQWGKHTLWERTSNVPFLWAGPGVAQGARVDTTVSLIDVFPTLVELCALTPIDGLEGHSLAPVLSAPQTASDRNVFLPYTRPEAYAVINQGWRYIQYEDGSEELYDQRQDPHEWHNLAKAPEMADIIRHMQSTAPKQFAPRATPITQLQLVLDGEDFYWNPKNAPSDRKRP